ncbi:YqaA family protein [Giesbergeria anulus]|uniref:Membrane protein YqaA, SNARE-associated domain n=1 Tax=Giesbergeria anulus TaxID=180197 RepID=A0A1H9PEM8_9BURK|nr:YqaA family protein [Giesbergeria anulus]SER46365.1 membrane protein YqaA, SNARE-associated domain [Giesbergeria anulus]
MIEIWLQHLLELLALPQLGLSTVFVVSFISATLLPLGSEPVVFGLVKLNPTLFWPTIAVATVGNTLGGAVSWWMGLGAHRAWQLARQQAPVPEKRQPRSRHERIARVWLRRFGAKACLLSWLPGVGDPLCAVAGWLQLPFWPCVGYMAVGKLLRYIVMTSSLLYLFPTLGAG